MGTEVQDVNNMCVNYEDIYIDSYYSIISFPSPQTRNIELVSINIEYAILM